MFKQTNKKRHLRPTLIKSTIISFLIWFSYIIILIIIDFDLDETKLSIALLVILTYCIITGLCFLYSIFCIFTYSPKIIRKFNKQFPNLGSSSDKLLEKLFVIILPIIKILGIITLILFGLFILWLIPFPPISSMTIVIILLLVIIYNQGITYKK